MRKKRMVLSGKKKVAAAVEYYGGSWADMNPEILVFILETIPIDEIIKTVSLVCKAWNKVVSSEYFWCNIHVDVADWSRLFRKLDDVSVDISVTKLMRWSKNKFRRLTCYGSGNSGFISIAIRGRYLTVLQMPLSSICDEIVLNHIKSLPNLKELDISQCSNITAKGLEAFGSHCKSLVCLKRNMDLKEHYNNICIDPLDDSEANVIADTMMYLQSLELGYGTFGNDGLFEILTKCKSLKHLVINGCFHVTFEGGII
ncbi:F-box protein FBW2-like [Rutidosis leptorrhynchoides]|uniref:F-box protein FBW2-like n=1 Tax=Rutidosis leptorrhynchoides TaxID=125765 RepID=UPI003A99B601